MKIYLQTMKMVQMPLKNGQGHRDTINQTNIAIIPNVMFKQSRKYFLNLK